VTSEKVCSTFQKIIILLREVSTTLVTVDANS